MKLLRVHVIAAASCGGLLDGLDVRLRGPAAGHRDAMTLFSPICIVGPNGAGKSQFIQLIAEMFQAALHTCFPHEERSEAHRNLRFELEYLIRPPSATKIEHMRISRISSDVLIEKFAKGQWSACDTASEATHALLPQKIVGYTSGGNETFSLPFLVSRAGYADEVERRAQEDAKFSKPSDTRLMLIDYSTHLEVLIANLLLGTRQENAALLSQFELNGLRSFRCVIRHRIGRRTLSLTHELRECIERLRKCATFSNYDAEAEMHTLDFFVTPETSSAFRHYWPNALSLYSAFHKLAMLNEHGLSTLTREAFRQSVKDRTFSSRPPEPQDEDKFFRFERVALAGRKGRSIEYVSLSDGEHQLAQILGMFCMVSFFNVIFLLDEPESHFNPQWRVAFISRLLSLPTSGGRRDRRKSASAQQDCLLTSHSPFVPSDLPRERVLIFRKTGPGRGRRSIDVRWPNVETFGTTFDSIVEECFEVRPPMADLSKQRIDALMKSQDATEVEVGLAKLGPSVRKAFLADHLRLLRHEAPRGK